MNEPPAQDPPPILGISPRAFLLELEKRRGNWTDACTELRIDSSKVFALRESDEEFREDWDAIVHSFTRGARDTFLAELKRSGTVVIACQASGIPLETAYRMRQADPVFSHEWNTAEHSWERLARKKATRAAQSKPQDFTERLRRVRESARVEREQRDQTAEAGHLLRSCAGYATPGIAVHVLPGESLALLDERAGVAETLDANEEFCAAWVQKCWIPSIDAVLRVVEPDVVERFEPRVTGNDSASEILREIFREVHQLYVELMRNRSAKITVIRRVADLRKQLGRDRYVIQQVFTLLAAHVDQASRPQPSAPAPQKLSIPRTIGEAGNWLVRIQSLAKTLGWDGFGWLPDLKRNAGDPAWQAPRCKPYFRVRALLDAARRIEPDKYDKARPEEVPIGPDLRRHLKRPDFEPEWADKATLRPPPC